MKTLTHLPFAILCFLTIFTQAQPVHHWETAVYEDDTWRIRTGFNFIATDWASTTFDDTNWSIGAGGFGYGDGDDNTEVQQNIPSFFYRKKFTVPDPSKIVAAILSMDYDDGFAAYLNGVEIARSTNLPPGTLSPATLADPDHEASMYAGGEPAAFLIDSALFASLLVAGENVLAVEIHNVLLTSSDLSGRTWLHFGIATAEHFFGENPPWFDLPGWTAAGEKWSEDEVLIYPNPASEALFVRLPTAGKAMLRLVDLVGTVALEAEFSDEAKVSVEGLAAGIYWVEIIGERRWVRRVVIR